MAHGLYTISDFTEAEIARKNVLAEVVIARHRICKLCGGMDDELDGKTCEEVVIEARKRLSQDNKPPT